MIIVSGKIYVRTGQRDLFLQSSLEAIVEARRTPGCGDFVVAADPIEPDRVNVYEEWNSAPELQGFRGDGPGSDLTKLIVRADVTEHDVNPHASN